MTKIAICMADGVEEIEALTVVDLCRRAGMEIDMISTQNRGRAMGGHGIQFETDLNIKVRNMMASFSLAVARVQRI